jgi:GTPase SAR1 family protein
MSRYFTTEVFTPTTPARLTFVERDGINDNLVSALRTPGKQIVVYGHSGSGKTTLLLRKLEQLYEYHVTSRCTKATTFDQLLLNAFEQLEHFYGSERASSSDRRTTAGLEAKFLEIKGQLGSEQTRSSSTRETRFVPPQLTPQTLARLLGAAKGCWIVEDFHKVNADEKARLAQAMKVFMDTAGEFSEVKIVAIGAVDTAREVVLYDPEMRHRVAEIEVPLMTEDELAQIVEKGTKLLGLRFESNLQRSIVWFSNGLASASHSLCLYICENIGVHENSFETLLVKFNELQNALDRYVSDASDTLKFSFEKAFKHSRKSKFDNYPIVVRALVSFGQDGAAAGQLLSRIRETEPKYPQTNIQHCLKQLISEERGSLIRYSDTSGKYSFADPIFRAFALTMFRAEGQQPQKERVIRVTLSEQSVRKLLGENVNQLELEFPS